MASLEQRFRAIERDNPNHSSFVNFVRTIEGQPLSKSRVVFYFKRFVSKGDYEKQDFKKLVNWVLKNKAFLAEKHQKSTLKASVAKSPTRGMALI